MFLINKEIMMLQSNLVKKIPCVITGIFHALSKKRDILLMTKVASGYKLMDHYHNQSIGFTFFLNKR